eukprot:8992543-Pyramimonas_sp.AAC.1
MSTEARNLRSPYGTSGVSLSLANQDLVFSGLTEGKQGNVACGQDCARRPSVRANQHAGFKGFHRVRGGRHACVN